MMTRDRQPNGSVATLSLSRWRLSFRFPQVASTASPGPIGYFAKRPQLGYQGQDHLVRRGKINRWNLEVVGRALDRYPKLLRGRGDGIQARFRYSAMTSSGN